MMTFDTHLKTIDVSSNLSEIKEMLDKSKVKVTFWGSRVVEVQGFTGSIYLDDLAIKITEAGHKRSETDDLSLKERIAGITIVNKVKRFYTDSDSQMEEANFFTRCINAVRTYFSYNTTRISIDEDEVVRNFLAYSKDKFLDQFEGSFGEEYRHNCSSGWQKLYGPEPCKEPRLRIFATEYAVQALYRKQ